MKIFLAIAFIFLSSSSANACKVMSDEMIIKTADKNSDNKIDFEEYKSKNNGQLENEIKLNWEADGGKKGYLTPDELLNSTKRRQQEFDRQHPDKVLNCG